MTDAEKKAAYKERLEQKTVVTSRLSETTRFIAFGIVAWVFAIHASSAEFSVNYIQAYGLWINTAGVLAVVSIASDYFQYLCAYFSVKHALLRADHNYKYNKNHLAYLLQIAFFIIKQFAVATGAAAITVTFALYVFTQ